MWSLSVFVEHAKQNRELMKKLQAIVNKLSENNIDEDGIYGPATEQAIFEVDQAELQDMVFNELVMKKSEDSTSKDEIMNYLAVAEGETVHYNKGEKDITSPYGIYRHAFPAADIFEYLDYIAESAGVSLSMDGNYQEAINFINRKLSVDKEFKKTVRDLAWEFYVDNFIDQKTIELLGPKSALTLFSLSVNGGKARGAKAIQTAVGVDADGIIGSGTRAAIAEAANDDDALNQGMLQYMSDFYDSLIEKNPEKYGAFKNGWKNRLRDLGYEG
jgi:lysozyme family protein